MTPTPIFKGEILLRRWSESSTQGVQAVFAFADIAEMEPIKAKTGKRFYCVLVELGDDEQPIPGKEIPAEKPREPHLGPNGWWAVMRCKEMDFLRFLNQKFPSADTVTNEAEAADLVRFVCCVDSRKELDDEKSRSTFVRLIKGPYQKYQQARGMA